MKKILGAHNANTYLKPRKWWMRLINFTSKCQKLTIKEQLEYGVRYFDFRIRYDKNLNTFICCHGPIEYKVEVLLLIHDIFKFKRDHPNESIYIRFVYDDTFNENNYNDDDISYLFITELFSFHMIGIGWELIRKSNWTEIDYNRWEQQEIIDCFKNYRGYKWIPWPRWWAKKNNKRLKKFMDEYQKGTPDKDTVFLFDFVDQST